MYSHVCYIHVSNTCSLSCAITIAAATLTPTTYTTATGTRTFRMCARDTLWMCMDTFEACLESNPSHVRTGHFMYVCDVYLPVEGVFVCILWLLIQEGVHARYPLQFWNWKWPRIPHFSLSICICICTHTHTHTHFLCFTLVRLGNFQATSHLTPRGRKQVDNHLYANIVPCTLDEVCRKGHYCTSPTNCQPRHIEMLLPMTARHMYACVNVCTWWSWQTWSLHTESFMCWRVYICTHNMRINIHMYRQWIFELALRSDACRMYSHTHTHTNITHPSQLCLLPVLLHTYMDAYTHIYTQADTDICMYVYIYIYTHTQTHKHTPCTTLSAACTPSHGLQHYMYVWHVACVCVCVQRVCASIYGVLCAMRVEIFFFRERHIYFCFFD